MERVLLSSFSREEVIETLKELGYEVDVNGFLRKDGKEYLDPYSEDKVVNINNMLILPGSVIIIDNNPISIAFYLQDEEHKKLFQ
jgi:hypothetical protein